MQIHMEATTILRSKLSFDLGPPSGMCMVSPSVVATLCKLSHIVSTNHTFLFVVWTLPFQPKRRCSDNEKSQEPQPQPTLHPSTILCLLHPFLPHHLTPSLLKEPPHGHPTAAVLDQLLQYPSECASSWPRLSQCRCGVVAFSGSWKPEVLWREEVDFGWFQSLVTNIDTCIYLKYR